MRAALRLTFLTATLATAYYFLLCAVNYALPWVFTPSWWRLSWPTQHSATLAWFQALNVVRTLVAALPISVVIAIFVKRHQYAVTLATAATTATVMVLGALIQIPPRGADFSIIYLVAFAAMAVSPPLLLWIGQNLRSKMRRLFRERK